MYSCGRRDSCVAVVILVDIPSQFPCARRDSRVPVVIDSRVPVVIPVCKPRSQLWHFRGPWLALCRSLQTLSPDLGWTCSRVALYHSPVELIIFVYLGQDEQRLRLGFY